MYLKFCPISWVLLQQTNLPCLWMFTDFFSNFRSIHNTSFFLAFHKLYSTGSSTVWYLKFWSVSWLTMVIIRCKKSWCTAILFFRASITKSFEIAVPHGFLVEFLGDSLENPTTVSWGLRPGNLSGIFSGFSMEISSWSLSRMPGWFFWDVP